MENFFFCTAGLPLADDGALLMTNLFKLTMFLRVALCRELEKKKKTLYKEFMLLAN